MQGEQHDALWRQPPLRARQEIEQHRVGSVGDARRIGGMGSPFGEWNFQGLLVHLAVVIDDGERHAAFEVGERQAGPLLGWIAVAIHDRAAGGAVMHPDHAVELAEQTLDHAALVHAASIAAADRHAIFRAASPERRSAELLGRIRHDLFRPSEGRPIMRDAAQFEPSRLRANGVGEAQRDR